MTLSDFPNELPAMTLDFQNSRQLDPRITFSRATTATYVKNGVVTTAPSDVPRFEEKGLLIEQSRTNDCEDSENFSTGDWGTYETSIVATNGPAPDGTNTASAVMETAVDDLHRLQYAYTLLTTCSTSVFVKPNGRENVVLQYLGGASQYVSVVFNLTGNGTKGEVKETGVYAHLDSGIEPLSNGWYRIFLTATRTTGAGYNYPLLLGTCTSSTPTLDETLGQEKFTGDLAKGVWVWGAQFEYEEGFPTSYIPTAGTAVTRAAEECVFNDSNILGSNSGTFIADATLYAYPAHSLQNEYVFLALAATIYDSVSITAGQNYSVQVLDSSIGPGYNNTGLINYPAYTSGVRVTTAAAYAPGPAGSSSADVVYASDGAMRGTNTATAGSTIPTGIYQMYLFRRENGVASSLATGYLHKLAFYPTRLSNTALEALTA